MPKHFDLNAYLKACKEGEEILAFCKTHQISRYCNLMDYIEYFPKDKQEIWFKRLCSIGFVKFLASHGIK